jgi:hypothetical protein
LVNSAGDASAHLTQFVQSRRNSCGNLTFREMWVVLVQRPLLLRRTSAQAL